jgi:hypothetical protein
MGAPDSRAAGNRWFGVRCVFRWPEGSVRAVPDLPQQYEERVTIWRAADFDEAISLAKEEAERYAKEADFELLDHYLAYLWDDDLEPGHGAEVFSLNRNCDLDPGTYLETFITPGTEDEGLFADDDD